MMGLRSHETPMEFQWDQPGGPVSKESEFQKALDRNGILSNDPTKKRPFSFLESPQKSGVFPSLRSPDTPGQTVFFDTKALPITPLRDFSDLAFNIPRNFDTEFCSSGPENESSPEQNADSEATPDTNPPLNTSRAHNKALQMSRTQQDKTLNFLGRIAQSPGKGEIARGSYSHALEKRIHKRRRREGERWLARRRWSNASESDADIPANPKAIGPSESISQQPSGVSSVFTFIADHPGLPIALSYWLQLLLNTAVVALLIYTVYSFYMTIRSDVDKKSAEAITDVLADIAKCTQSYRENRCDAESRAPALEAVCENWGRCMNKDYMSIGRARVSAHTFAEIFNSFVEPISYKAMIFSLAMVFGCVASVNLAFGVIRNRPHNTHASAPPQGFVPQTPGGYWTPFPEHDGRSPQPSQRHFEAQTPARKLLY